jgi:hypothetical protein
MKSSTKKKRERIQVFFNLVGWYGAVAVLGGYVLISFSVLQPLDLTYQLLNLSGSIGLGLICYYKRTYQPLFVNIVWGIIALLAIVNILVFISS